MATTGFPEKVAARLKEGIASGVILEPSPMKGVLNFRISNAGDWLGVFKILKEELGFEFLDFVTAVDWRGPVDAKGFILDPNPNPFLPEGAVPAVVPEPPTPGFPYREKMEAVAAVSNWREQIRVVVRCELDRERGVISSLIPLWKSADWQERENFDLLGVQYEGHPNLKKILTPEFMKGHPLRKDYIHIKDQYD